MDWGDVKNGIGGVMDPGNMSGYGFGGQFFDPAGIGQNSTKKNAPKAPDYKGAAEAQAGSGRDAAQANTVANRPNQYTGFGSNQWTQGPDGSWTQNTQLNGQLGGALGNLQGQALYNSQRPMDNGTAARDQAIKGAYGQATSRLNPQFKLQDEQVTTNLANQGIDPNSAAGRAAMQQEAFAKNDAYGSAMNSAIAQGTAAQQATFGENMAAQMMPYQQMNALQGYQNGMPGFNAATPWGATPYLQAAEDMGGYNMNAWQSMNQNKADMWGGAGSAAGGLLMAMSDERVKTNVKRLDVEAAPGIPMATFKYKHAPERGTHLGVVAQDVEKVRPDAVHTNEAGIKSVDYSKLRPFGVR